MCGASPERARATAAGAVAGRMPLFPLLRRSLLLALFLSIAGSPGAPAQQAEPIAPQRAARERGALDLAPTLRYVGDLDGVLARRTLRVLVVPSRTHYFVDRGVQRGLTHDEFSLFGKVLEQRHAARLAAGRVNVVFVPVCRDEILEALRDGRGDVAAANLAVTPAHQELVDFTSPVVENVDEIIVSARGVAPLRSLEDLAGRTVHVRLATSYFESLAALNERLDAAGLAPMRLELLPDEIESEDELEMLDAGVIQLAVIEAPIFELWKQTFPNVTAHPDLVVRRSGSIAWAVRKSSPELRGALDAFLANELRVGSQNRNMLHARYLRSARWAKPAASAQELARYERTTELFRRYGTRYGFDGLLLLAQAFQESRLDQSVVSPRGAVGLMQVMPATARELRVGDVHRAEHNVHAGAAYLRKLITTYFDEPQLEERDRMMFALASYNAGPTRIQRLRGEARKLGYSPDVWLGNVERVAAERIGREPVEYVRNVLKYYVAYRLVAEESAARASARKSLLLGS